MDVFPNPVRDILYVRPDSPSPVTAALHSRSGARVLSESGQAGPFEPLRMDVSGLRSSWLAFATKLLRISRVCMTSR